MTARHAVPKLTSPGLDATGRYGRLQDKFGLLQVGGVLTPTPLPGQSQLML
jgi:hypothetical protein